MSAVAVKAIAHVEGGADLDAATSTAVFQALMAGEMSENQISTLLAAIAAKGPCVDEIEGAARAMREALVEVPTSRVPIDTCGTGGSGVPRRNVSTAVALVVASASAAADSDAPASVSLAPRRLQRSSVRGGSPGGAALGPPGPTSRKSSGSRSLT